MASSLLMIFHSLQFFVLPLQTLLTRLNHRWLATLIGRFPSIVWEK
jgi:hypothetical protein